MYQIYKTDTFMDWLTDLGDTRAQKVIAQRIDRAECGNLGDHKSVGDGVSEMRITYGPGYRLYYTVRGREIIILLCGGDKKTQQHDIDKAKQMAKEV